MDKRSGKKDKSKDKKKKKKDKIEEAVVTAEKLPAIQQKPTNKRQKK